MLLRVVHKDGRYDFVSVSGLALLIENREITKFKRSDGWIHINSPYVRKTNSPPDYTGPERRLH
jgi:hypothetical protein